MATRTAASNSAGSSSGRPSAQPAARSAARPAGRAAKAPLLPPAIREFIKLRTVEVTGLILASSGLLLILVLLTYERGDPSWNTAVNPEANPKIANILGLPGAYVADLLMQWVGVASYLLGGIVMAWGLRIMSHRGLSRLPLRVFLAMIGVLLASIFFAQVPAFPGWQLTHGHLGGTAGAILLAALSKLTGGLLDVLDRSLIAMIAGGVSAVSIIGALDLSLRDWRDGARNVGWAVGAAGRGAREAGGMAGQAARGASDIIRNPSRFGGLADILRFGWDTDDGDDQTPAPVKPKARTGRPGERREPVLDEPGAQTSGRRPATATGAPAGSGNTPDAPDQERPPRTVPVVTPILKPASPPSNRGAGTREPMLDLVPQTDYELPPLDLLQLPDPSAKPSMLDEDALQQNAVMLEGVLADFGVRGEIQKVHPGPVVTLYELEPAPGTKSSRVIGLADDIARSMSAVSVRVAVVPSCNVIGIELPNARREMVLLR